MEESLTLDGRIGAMKTTNSLMFHLWDQAVPALPIIAQSLLGGLPGAGRLQAVSATVGVRRRSHSPLAPSPRSPGERGLSSSLLQ